MGGFNNEIPLLLSSLYLSNDGETAPANLLVWPSGSLGFSDSSYHFSMHEDPFREFCSPMPPIPTTTDVLPLSDIAAWTRLSDVVDVP